MVGNELGGVPVEGDQVWSTNSFDMERWKQWANIRALTQSQDVEAQNGSR